MRKIVYWDSMAFLRVFKVEDDHERYDEVIESAKVGATIIVTSALTLVEVVRLNSGKIRMDEKAEETIRGYFKRDYIKVFSVTATVSEEARKMIWSHDLMRDDAIHIATAVVTGASELHTTDPALIKLDNKYGFYVGPPRMTQTRFKGV